MYGASLLSTLILFSVACDSDSSGEGPTANLLRVDVEQSGEHCVTGGVAIHSGLDDDEDGALDDPEILATNYVCNGELGQMGVSGAMGGTGVVGPTGAEGEQGQQGVAGPAGAEGAEGPAGAAGAQGIQGPRGTGIIWVDQDGSIADDVVGDLDGQAFFDDTGTMWRLFSRTGLVGRLGSATSAYESTNCTGDEFLFADLAPNTSFLHQSSAGNILKTILPPAATFDILQCSFDNGSCTEVSPCQPRTLFRANDATTTITPTPPYSFPLHPVLSP